MYESHSAFSPALVIVYFSHLNMYGWHLNVVLICTFLLVNDIENIFYALLAILCIFLSFNILK